MASSDVSYTKFSHIGMVALCACLHDQASSVHPLTRSPGLLATFIFGDHAMLRTILLVILILALVGALPTWPYSTGWGYYPSGGVGLIVLILLVLALTGRL